MNTKQPSPTSPSALNQHSHMFLSSSHDENARRTRSVVILTFVMMVLEIAAGYLTGSMALLADGFHMATHAGALAIAASAYAYAKRHANNRTFSFGTGKVGELAGFTSALILAMVSIAIAVESAARLFNPVSVAFGQAIWIAVLGLAVNIASAFLLGGHHHGHTHHQSHGHSHGHSHEHPHEYPHEHEHGHPHAESHSDGHGSDNNLRSAYVHVLADALTSVLAIIALLAGRYLGWVWLDPVMGLVGSIVIARWAWTLMRDTAAILLDRTDSHVEEEMREILQHGGDVLITDLHVWKVGPEAHAAIVSVMTRPGVSADVIRERLAPVHEIRHLTIEQAFATTLPTSPMSSAL